MYKILSPQDVKFPIWLFQNNKMGHRINKWLFQNNKTGHRINKWWPHFNKMGTPENTKWGAPTICPVGSIGITIAWVRLWFLVRNKLKLYLCFEQSRICIKMPYFLLVLMSLILPLGFWFIIWVFEIYTCVLIHVQLFHNLDNNIL